MPIESRVAAFAFVAALAWPSHAAAEHHHGGPPMGSGFRSAPVFFGFAPFYGRGFGFGYGYGLGYGYGPRYWGYPGAGFGPGIDNEVGSARIQVTPKQAQVYVDGYLAGTADDYDGFSQRLRLPPGGHEIAVYLEGYRPLVEPLMFTIGHEIKLKQALQPLAPGEAAPPRPRPHASRTRASAPGAPAERYGTLMVRAYPAGRVSVDGEAWMDVGGDDPTVVPVPEGKHTIEVQREGGKPLSTKVQVRPGDVTLVAADLR